MLSDGSMLGAYGKDVDCGCDADQMEPDGSAGAAGDCAAGHWRGDDVIGGDAPPTAATGATAIELGATHDATEVAVCLSGDCGLRGGDCGVLWIRRVRLRNAERIIAARGEGYFPVMFSSADGSCRNSRRGLPPRHRRAARFHPLHQRWTHLVEAGGGDRQPVGRPQSGPGPNARRHAGSRVRRGPQLPAGRDIRSGGGAVPAVAGHVHRRRPDLVGQTPPVGPLAQCFALSARSPSARTARR